MGVAIPAAAYSTGDVELVSSYTMHIFDLCAHVYRSVRNALHALYDNQDLRSGSFPYCGPPLTAHGSVTYHM